MPTLCPAPVPINGASLRPYQREVIFRVAAQVIGRAKRILLVAPTGSGKTVIAADLVRDAAAVGLSVLFLVHRRELIFQASRKLHAAGLDHGIVAAGFTPRPREALQLASISTLHARAMRTAAMALPAADVILVDEAHHATARTWRRLIDAYPQAVVIGLTATPCRGDGRGLGGIFEALVECPQVGDLIAAGHLVPTRVFAPSVPDLSGVRVRHGDYVESELARRVDTNQLVGDVVTHWHRLANRRRTAVFAVSVAHSIHLRDEFRRSGVVAEHIDGTTPVAERDAILARLAAGSTEVVCNCGVLTEGWDSPDVACIVMARPTKSLGLYRQIVGRGLRPAMGKDHVLLLDHSGATFEHGLIEEPVAWTLAPDRCAVRQSQGTDGIKKTRALTTCPECAAVRWQGNPCTACGWRPMPKAAPVEVIDGDLAEVTPTRQTKKREATADEKRAFHRQLQWIARDRGYRSGWVAHKYREKFGVWPKGGSDDPLIPTAEVRAWVRSRQIAYAKARGAA